MSKRDEAMKKIASVAKAAGFVLEEGNGGWFRLERPSRVVRKSLFPDRSGDWNEWPGFKKPESKA
jgi:hypothetical protein